MSHRSEGRGGRTISLKGRIVAAILVAATVFLGLIFRLWYLQIGQGAAFRDRSDLNRIKTVFVPPPRGIIVDRSGLELVTNRPSFAIEFIKEDAPDPIGVVRQLADILGMDANLLLSFCCEISPSGRLCIRHSDAALSQSPDRIAPCGLSARGYASSASEW
jgi:cell division protein FtsI/penicillin-binding protein 2